MRTLPRARSWYRIVNHAPTNNTATSADVYLYGAIGWDCTAEDLVDQLKGLTVAEINVRINSAGGDVLDALAIHRCLKSHAARVTVHVDGLAASAASFIAQAGDRIITARNAMWMVHDAMTGCWGDAGDMRRTGDVLDKHSDNIADIYAYRSGKPVDGWREAMRAETWYTGAEAVTAGLADEMTDPDPDELPEEMTAAWDLSEFEYRNVPAVLSSSGSGVASAPGGAEGQAPASGVGAVEPSPVPEPIPVYASGGLVGLGAAVGRHGTAGSGGCVQPVLAVTTIPAATSSTTPPAPAPPAPAPLTAPAAPTLTDSATEPIDQPVNTAVGPHESTAKEGTWDAAVNTGRLPSPVPVATARKVYTTYESDKVEDGKLPKGACHLPHHFVGEDGTPGAASVNGCNNALARLGQTHGLSDAEKATAERHLRGHLPAGESDSAGDEWAAATAALTADPWHALTGTLLSTVDKDDDFARLKEGLLA